MTIAEMIAMVDEIRPNQISKQTKTMWLSEIEHKVFDEVMSRAIGFCPRFEFKPYIYDLNDATQLAAPDVYADVYRTYLYAKIDLALGEIDRYNNDAALHAQAWTDYAAWYRRTHRPDERRNKCYGAFAFLPHIEPPKPADATGTPGPEPDPDLLPCGIRRHGECFEPVLPCHCCANSKRNDTDPPVSP